jgi:hypothetical protein
MILDTDLGPLGWNEGKPESKRQLYNPFPVGVETRNTHGFLGK